MADNFMLMCNNCGWKFVNSGRVADLAHLKEIPSCCNKRKYRCLKCGMVLTLKRVR